MKHITLISLIVGAFLLTGCPEKAAQGMSDLQRVQQNNMDLPNPMKYYFNGVQYRLSNIFIPHYNDDYVISSMHDIKMNPELHLHFSIESFSRDDAEGFRFSFGDSEDIKLLDAVHDHYAVKRNESLEEAKVNIKKDLPKTVGFPGYIQVISGSVYRRSAPNSYFFATLELEDQFLVVQLIGKEENMGYLYDDFLEILSSISL